MVAVGIPGGTRGGQRAQGEQSIIKRGTNSGDGSEREVGVTRTLGVVNSLEAERSGRSKNLRMESGCCGLGG